MVLWGYNKVVLISHIKNTPYLEEPECVLDTKHTAFIEAISIKYRIIVLDEKIDTTVQTPSKEPGLKTY